MQGMNRINAYIIMAMKESKRKGETERDFMKLKGVLDSIRLKCALEQMS